MPVSFGMRNEENERINTVLKQLIALTHVPEDWNETPIEDQLQHLGLTMQSLMALSIENLLQHLQDHHFDYSNMEQFADLLTVLYKKHGFALKDNAIAVYNFIQRESKMFSFGIIGKINGLSN